MIKRLVSNLDKFLYIVFLHSFLIFITSYSKRESVTYHTNLCLYQKFAKKKRWYYIIILSYGLIQRQICIPATHSLGFIIVAKQSPLLNALYIKLHYFIHVSFTACTSLSLQNTFYLVLQH